MCDSFLIFFETHGMTVELMKKETQPFQVKSISNQDDEILGRNTVAYNARSSLTGAGYKITPVFDKAVNKPIVLQGYLVEMNVPACTIGNNVLIQNLVFNACTFAELFLRQFLLANGCTRKGADRISLADATIKELDLTYLVECETHAAALELNDQIYHHADAVVNPRPATSKKKDVFRVGNGADSTVYIKGRDHELSAYVKASKAPKAFSNLKGLDAPALYSLGATHVRLTAKLKGGFLRANGLDKPRAWKMSKGRSNPHAIGIELARARLRLDENLRAVSPKPNYIAKLSQDDQVVLAWHLQGQDARQHRHITDHANPKKQFTAVSGRILKTLRIDLNIPWDIQSAQVSPPLAKALVFGGQYQPPQHLANFCFCRKSLKPLLLRLKQLVEHAYCAGPASPSWQVRPATPMTPQQQGRVLLQKQQRQQAQSASSTAVSNEAAGNKKPNLKPLPRRSK